MLYEFFYTCLFIFEVVNRLHKHFYLNLLLSECLTFNVNNVKKLKKKINIGISEIFLPSFQENNLIFNAFALKLTTRNNIKASFNFKKKDFVKDYRIYKLNLKLNNFKYGLMVFHKFSNTSIPGLMLKKISFKLNDFSKLNSFSFLFEDCLKNLEASLPSFKSKYSTYYDVGFTLKTGVFPFLESLLKNFQIPLNLQEYKGNSYKVIRKNKLKYSL